MKAIALSDEMSFLYCPFMKTRAINIIDSALASATTMEKILCYVAQGVPLDEFSMTEEKKKEREDYLKHVGIL